MMQSDGRLLAFVERPIAATLAAITLAVWIGLAWKAWRGRTTASLARREVTAATLNMSATMDRRLLPSLL